MNTTTNIYIVHTYNSGHPTNNRFHGVYSSKELADAAGKDYCETWGENLHYTVAIARAMKKYGSPQKRPAIENKTKPLLDTE